MTRAATMASAEWFDHSKTAAVRRRVRRILLRLAQRHLAMRAARPGTHRFDGLVLAVPTGVFHPGLFLSTSFLCRTLLTIELAGRSFLEVGCGSGLVAIVAARAGATVTALDINPAAVGTTIENAAANNVNIEVRQSDLFASIEADRRFDVVAVNPPYFRKDPADVAERAWFAGANFEYFSAFFAQLASHSAPDSLVLMILGEDCDLSAIAAHAADHGFVMQLWRSGVVWFERQLVFTFETADSVKDDVDRMRRA